MWSLDELLDTVTTVAATNRSRYSSARTSYPASCATPATQVVFHARHACTVQYYTPHPQSRRLREEAATCCLKPQRVCGHCGGRGSCYLPRTQKCHSVVTDTIDGDGSAVSAFGILATSRAMSITLSSVVQLYR